MKILCCGDSHAGVFNYCNEIQKDFTFEVRIVSGATAQGAVNPNSKTDALNLFKEKIDNTGADKLLIMLGEVDCGFVIWVRAKRYEISVDDQINMSIDNLFSFLDNILTTTNYANEDIIVAGAILPTIKDSTDKKFLSGARSEVDVTQLERTEKTIEYNILLRDKCNQCGYKYVEITNDILSNEGIVKDDFLNENPVDHHLDHNKTSSLWISQLKHALL